MNPNNRGAPVSSGQTADWKKKTVLFIGSQTSSMFGSMLVGYAIIWHVTLTTESGSAMMIATLVSFLPQILISIFAGVWADRFNRKLMIIGADVLTAVSTLILAIAFLLDYQELWLIFLIAGIRSLGAGIQTPAVNSLTPQIVPGEQLMRVNSINATVQPFIQILSPIISGAMLSLARVEYLFFLDLITAAIAVGLLLATRVAPQPQDEDQPKGYFDDLRAGLTYVRETNAVRGLFTYFAFTFFLVAPVAFLSPLLVARSYGEEVWRLTANEITFFGGSILGGILMTAWGGFSNRFRTLGLTTVMWAVFLTALGLSRDFVLYLVIMVLVGLPMPFFNASATTLLQELAPPEMHGRVFGVQGLIIGSVMPLGMLVFGPIADTVRIETLLVISGLLMALPGLWIFFKRYTLKPVAKYEMQAGD
mgnify:CR=1 FL=1